MSHSVEYRADIDGLRAVAVLSVLLFHSNLSLGPLLFRGGFLGVDVFFVISGFLITSILCRELKETGRISIARFYDRRLRRIAPPPAPFDPGQCYLRSVAYEDQSSDCTWSFPAEHGVYPLPALADQFLDLSEVLCPDDLCAAAQNDTLIYKDNGHLSPSGSEYVMQSNAARRFLANLGIPGSASE